MASSETIEHSGIISDVRDDLIKVSIKAESACHTCRVRGSCSIGDKEVKTIEVFRKKGETYSVGEEIKVVLERSLGMKALGLGYIAPFLILVVILSVLISIGLNEGLAGMLSLVSLVPYYFGLSFFRDKLKKEFSFRLQKM